MRFSEAFGITRTEQDDWFDPHLTVDTNLFIDPLLLLETGGEWAEGHKELIRFFSYCYELVAKGGDPNSQSAKAALRLLSFPEPHEFCLGYTASGTRGAGTGTGFAQTMRDGIAVAISSGLNTPEHIEEIGILNEGIGADRISDVVANVLKHHFITYTQDVCNRHNVEMWIAKVRNAHVNLDGARWIADSPLLPLNPETGEPILLVPARILNELPTLNAEAWFQSSINADVRESLNLQIGKSVPKHKIVELARRHPERIRQWAREQTSRTDLKGYDVEADPLGVIHWDRNGTEYLLNNPPTQRDITTSEELYDLLDELIKDFKHYIEERRGWSQLWNEDKTEKKEQAIQLAFLGMAEPYLRRFGVVIDREVDLGRGPVDFKLSKGISARVLIEVKKLHNGKFWHGLKKQLPSYLASDNATHGWLLAVQYRDSESSETRRQKLPSEVARIASETNKHIRYTLVDARPKESASNIKDT